MKKPLFKKLTAITIPFLAIMLLLAGCNKKTESNQEAADTLAIDESIDDTTTMEEDAELQKFNKATAFAQGIPSALHVAEKFKLAGLEFVSDLHSSPDNANKYISKYSKAMNLGVYSSDLSYFIINNQNQETISSLKAAKKLATDLGIGVAYEESEILQRFEANLGMKDSLLEFLTDVAIESDMILKEEEKFDLVFVGFSGAWIESIYIASTLANETGNKALMRTVLMQEPSLDNLLELIDSFKENEEMAPIITKLQELNKIMSELSEPIEQSEDPSTAPVDVEKFKIFTEKINQVREDVINMV